MAFQYPLAQGTPSIHSDHTFFSAPRYILDKGWYFFIYKKMLWALGPTRLLPEQLTCEVGPTPKLAPRDFLTRGMYSRTGGV